MSEIETWLSLVIIVILTIVICLSLLFVVRKASSSFMSKTIFCAVTAYGLLITTILFLVGSIIQQILSPQYNTDYWQYQNPSFEQLPIIKNKIFDIFGFCFDVLSLLVIGMVFIILISSFVFSQISLNLLAKRLKSKTLQPMSQLIKNKFPWLNNTDLIIINDIRPDAFSFNFIHFDFWNLEFKEIIVLSSGMIELLNDHELEAVLAHEYSHSVNEDSRYSHLLFILSSIIFFDPILRIFKRYMHDNQEYKADLGAVELVQKPKSLARALYKLTAYYNVNPNRNKVLISTSLIGQDKELVRKRIKKLISYAKMNNLDL